MFQRFLIALLALGWAAAPRSALAQDRLKTLPGYERFQKFSKEITNSVKLGTLSVTWKEGGKSFDYTKDGKSYHYDIAGHKASEITPGATNPPPVPAPLTPDAGRRAQRGQTNAPARGRQFAFAVSPDGKSKAVYHDRNLWLTDTNGTPEVAITTDGNATNRIKYGTASWVYGEELFQNTAIWWSPDSQKVAYYRFDERPVPDYVLQLDQTKLESVADIEAYALAGGPNPIADLFVYDVATKKQLRLDVRDGQPFTDAALGYYVYHVSWSADGKALLFYRTNRRQNIMEFVAADPATGKCRVIVREAWPASWVENLPTAQFLKDGQRFIWSSERYGWKNFYLYELSGKLLATLTDHPFEDGAIARVVEEAGLLFYTTRSGDNPIKLQLHRVGLDGRGDRRLTDQALNHTVDVAPDGAHFIDIAQTHDTPPTTRLLDADGNVIEELAKSDLTKFKRLGLKRVELFTFKAADGETDLYGMLHRPSNFDPNRHYPLLVSVYAGPATTGARETFTLPNPLTEYGFLVATLDSRSASGRGKRFLDAIYQKLGTLEIDDQAAGVKRLTRRPYVDARKVGIYGVSYGGTAAAAALLRHPDVFKAASSSSPVTDFRDYDTIYTERYMGLPQENKAGYDAGSLVLHADQLKGRLLLYYGTADNNVHPNNAMQFIQALQRAGKSFEVQVGPDLGHSAVRQDRMMEFFIENLTMRLTPLPR